jgi:hypothetical protein
MKEAPRRLGYQQVIKVEAVRDLADHRKRPDVEERLRANAVLRTIARGQESIRNNSVAAISGRTSGLGAMERK